MLRGVSNTLTSAEAPQLPAPQNRIARYLPVNPSYGASVLDFVDHYFDRLRWSLYRL
jgi:hypothetical protein